MEWIPLAQAAGDFSAVQMTIAGILLAGLVVCGTVIKILYTAQQTRFLSVEEKLTECERDRAELWKQQSIDKKDILEQLAKVLSAVNR